MVLAQTGLQQAIMRSLNEVQRQMPLRQRIAWKLRMQRYKCSRKWRNLLHRTKRAKPVKSKEEELLPDQESGTKKTSRKHSLTKYLWPSQGNSQAIKKEKSDNEASSVGDNQFGRKQRIGECDGEDENTKICKFCHSGEEDVNSAGDLIAPCKCSGSCKWVHRNCLDDWRKLARNQDAMTTCSVCKEEFVMEGVLGPSWLQIKLEVFFGRTCAHLGADSSIVGVIALIATSINWSALLLGFFTLLVQLVGIIGMICLVAAWCHQFTYERDMIIILALHALTLLRMVQLIGGGSSPSVSIAVWASIESLGFCLLFFLLMSQRKNLIKLFGKSSKPRPKPTEGLPRIKCLAAAA